MRREFIEFEVAKAIKDYILQDDVIGQIADMVETYQKERNNGGEMLLLQGQLKETQKSIKNMLNAIEMGVVTSSTKDRLMELEDEQSRINQQIIMLKAETPDVSREDVMSWLESFRAGDAARKEYQHELFKSFLKAAYLFDDGRLKLAFDPIKHNNSSDLDVMLDNETKNKIGECSYNSPSV